MEWLEIIELRSNVLDNTALKDTLTNILKEIHSGSNENKIKFYYSDTIETDFSVIIAHRSGPPVRKSKLGRHIHIVLKNFGLTNHKIWVTL